MALDPRVLATFKDTMEHEPHIHDNAVKLSWVMPDPKLSLRSSH